MVGNPEVICPGSGLVMGSRLVGTISVLGIDPSLIMGYAETTLLFSWKLPTFAVSCRCHANGDEWRQMVTKTEKRK